MWLSVSALCLVVVLCGGKQVTLPDLGTLDGTISLSAWTNRSIYQYQGIPYAEPPTGSRRFKRPVAYKGKWPDTFNATEFGPVCPQDNGVPLDRGRQDENCLHINVYTTQVGSESLGEGMPVMVYLHGGSFRVGSARNILPNYLLEEDVVLVVPQYRLGPLGFLSLKTDEVPGNQGMLDILLALEWVHMYIQYFDGDPNRVTLFGQSAGAAAATLMLFSPLVHDGMIARVITLGGSALGTWAVDHTPIENAQMIAAHANCTQSNFTELAECLRATKVQDLLTAHAVFRKQKSGGNQVVYNEAEEQSFLLKDPHLLLKESNYRRLPVLGGVTKHECSFCVADIYDTLVATNLLDSEDFLSRDLTRFALQYSGVDERSGFVADVIRDQYFNDDDFKNFTRMVPGLVDITSGLGMKAPVLRIVSEISRNTSSYLYTFNYFGRFTTYGYFSTFGLNSSLWKYPFPPGVAHADELLYIFPQEYAVLNEEEISVAKKMVQFFTSFAATGVPSAEGSPAWPKVTTATGPYMKIERRPTVHDNFIDEYKIASREGLAPISGSTSGSPLKFSILVIPSILARYL